MIRKNSLFCKLIRIKFSSKVLYYYFFTSVEPEKETCPFCFSKGNCHIHAYYGRSLFDFINNSRVSHDITIVRVICDSCGHTHALLPDLIIPYDQYSLFFILRVLAEHFLSRSSIEELCERFGISRNLFFKWLKLWNTHKQIWFGVLCSMETGSLSFLKHLVSTSFSSFSSAFIRRFSFSFLQSHRNPAGYCQQVFDP